MIQVVGILSSEVPALTGWDYGRIVSVNNQNTGIALTDCQIKITLTSSNFTFANADPNGDDLRVYYGSTDLPIYIESYDDVAETAVVWFKADIPLHAARSFYLYYGNPAASSVSVYDSVFENRDTNDAVGLWNFDEGTGSSVNDEASTHDMTLVGGYTWEDDLTFASGNSVEFNGTTGYGTITGVLDSYNNNGHIALDIIPATTYPTGNDAMLVCKWNDYAIDGIVFYIQATTGKLIFTQFTNIGTYEGSTPVDPGFFRALGADRSWTSGTKYTVAATWNAYYITLYINGVVYAKAHRSVFASGADSPVFVGVYTENGSTFNRFFHGKIDCLKIGTRDLSEAAALADYEKRKIIPASQYDKWTQSSTQEGDVALDPASEAWHDVAVGEIAMTDGPSGDIAIAFTGYDGALEQIGTATVTTATGAWTETAGNPTFGVSGYGSEEVNRPWLTKSGSTYYLYLTNKADGDIYLWTSTDFITWASEGLQISHTVVGFFGNHATWPVQVGGKYHLFADAFNGTTWVEHHFTADNLDGPWTWIQALTTLEVVSGKVYGGPMIHHDGTKWHIWYQYGGDPLDPGTDVFVPTRLIYKNSTDGNTWSNPDFVMEMSDRDVPNVDQVADPMIKQVSGKTYMWASLLQNLPAIEGDVRRWEFNGTLSQLVAGGHTVTVLAEQSI